MLSASDALHAPIDECLSMLLDPPHPPQLMAWLCIHQNEIRHFYRWPKWIIYDRNKVMAAANLEFHKVIL